MKDIVPVSLTTLGHTKPCVCVPGYQEEPVNGALVCSGIILSLKINCCVMRNRMQLQEIYTPNVFHY